LKIAFIKVSSHPKEFSHTKDGIELTGTLTRTRGHKVELNAQMRGEIILDCDRCAKKYPYRIDTPLEFALYDKVFPLENEEDLDSMEFLDGIIDIDEIIQSEVASIESFYHVCEDCENCKELLEIEL